MRIIIFLLILASSLFGQFAVPKVKLSTEKKNTETLTQGATVNDSVGTWVNRRSARIDSTTSNSPRITFPANVEIITNSQDRDFSDTTNVGNWVLQGDGFIDASNDSTLLYSNVPITITFNSSAEQYTGTIDDGISDDFADWIENTTEGKIEAVSASYTGSVGVKIERTIGTTVYQLKVYDDYIVEANTDYKLEFYTKGDGVNSGYYSIYDVTNSSYISNYTSTGISSTSYKKLTYSFTTPSGCTSIRLQIAGGNVVGSVIYYDDFNIYKVNNASNAQISVPGLKKNQGYEVSFDYKKVINDVRIKYSLTNLSDSTDTVTTAWQTLTKRFISNVGEDDNYYSFDGVEDHKITHTDFNADSTDDWSVFFRLKVDDTDTYDFALFGGDETFAYSSLGYRFSTNSVYSRSSANVTIQSAVTGLSVMVQKSHTICWTIDGNGGFKVYINGDSVASVSDYLPILLSDLGDGYAGTLPLIGNIYEYKLYDRELSASEVSSLNSHATISSDSLKVNFIPKNITTSTWKDASGNGNDGTVNGATYKQTELTISLSDTANIKIDNVSIKEIQDYYILAYGATKYFQFIRDISTVGNYPDEKITVYSSVGEKIIDVPYSVEGSSSPVSTPANLAIIDSSDGNTLRWDANSETISGYYVYRSTDNINYYWIATVSPGSEPSYQDNNIIEALRYYYKVSAYLDDTESALTSSVNAKSLVTTSLYAAVYYVDSTATAGGDGSFGNPFNSSSNIIWSSLAPNSIIFFKGDQYHVGQIYMGGVSGTSSQRIVLASYGSTKRAKMTYDMTFSNTNYILLLSNTTDDGSGASYITIKDLEFVGPNWIVTRRGTDNIFDNVHCHFYKNEAPYINTSGGAAPFQASAFWEDQDLVARLTIKNSIFEGWFTNNSSGGDISDLVAIRDRDQVLIDSCMFKNTNHELLSFSKSDRVVVRNSRFYNSLHAGFNMQYMDQVLVENNYIERQGNNIGDGFLAQNGKNEEDIGAIYFSVKDGIFRNNIIRRSGAEADQFFNIPFSALQMMGHYNTAFENDVQVDVQNNRVYNNTFYDNYGVALRMGLGTGGKVFADNKVFNNLFVLNGDPTFERYGTASDNTVADSVQIYMQNDQAVNNYYPSNNEVSYNYLGYLDNTVFDHIDSGSPYDANEYPYTSRFNFHDNLDGAGSISVFTEPYDSIEWEIWDANGYQKLADSLKAIFTPTTDLKDKGRHLAQLTTDASGTSLTVDDAEGFFDGFGWLDGDSIVVTDGEAKSYTRIASISGNTLTVNSSISAAADAYVNIVNGTFGEYRGSGVDIGALEYSVPDTSAPTISNVQVVYLTDSTARWSAYINPNNLTTDIELYKGLDSAYLHLETPIIPIPSPISTAKTIDTVLSVVIGQKYFYQWKTSNSKGNTNTAKLSYTHKQPSQVTGQVTAYPANGYDDLRFWGTTGIDVSGLDIYFGNNGTDAVGSALRFVDIVLPSGSIVDSVFITITASASSNAGELVLWGEDSTNAPIYTSNRSELDTRRNNKTTASTTLTTGSWVAESTYRVTATSIVSELLSDAGGSYNGAMSFFFEDNSTASGVKKKFYAYDNGSKYPKIDIFYH